jgi:isoleucyl-tRNA synthetase
VRWLSPVLVFTSEEVWGTRYPDAGSVHLLEWPEVPLLREDGLLEHWKGLRLLRSAVSEQIEPLRRNKFIGSSLEARVVLELDGSAEDEALGDLARSVDFAELAIVASMEIEERPIPERKIYQKGEEETKIIVARTPHHKCGRCWRHLPEVREDGDLCARCEGVVNG